MIFRYFAAMKMRALLFLFLLAFSGAAGAQSTDRYVSLGGNHWGLCFGNAHQYSGLRLNLYDLDTRRINGLNISILGKGHHFFFDADSTRWKTAATNGLHLGVIHSGQVRVNGISVGGLFNTDRFTSGVSFSAGFNTSGVTRYGLAVGLLTLRSKKIYGIGFGGFHVTGEDLAGFIFSGLAISASPQAAIKRMRGIAIAGVQNEAEQIHGLAIAGGWVSAFQLKGVGVAALTVTGETHGLQIGIVNSANTLRGFQVGLLNRARNNPKWSRVMPLVNWHFAKEKEDTAWYVD